MTSLKYLGIVIGVFLLLVYPSLAATNTTCGVTNQSVSGNITVNYTINGTLFCSSGVDWLNITEVTTDTNVTKLFNFSANNWTMGVRLILNNTDNSSNYTVRVYNGTNTTGNVSHNVTIKSNSTGFIQFNLTGFNNSGWINISKVPGDNTTSSTYIYSAVFAVLVAGGAAIYLRRIRKV